MPPTRFERVTSAFGEQPRCAAISQSIAGSANDRDRFNRKWRSARRSHGTLLYHRLLAAAQNCYPTRHHGRAPSRSISLRREFAACRAAETAFHLNWDDLKYVLAVAKHGSLSGAARKLRATQPTVGRRIAALETRLGVKLFRRLPGSFVLTTAALAGAAVATAKCRRAV